MLVFHFIIHFLWSRIHHTSMDREFRTCAMQTNICNAHINATYKFMSLLPLLVCFKILIDPLTMSFHLFSPPISYYLCEFSPALSTIRTKGEHKFLISWGETMWNKDHFSNLVQSRLFAKIFNSVWSKDKLLHTS